MIPDENRRLHSERCASPSAVTQALAFRVARPIAWKLMKRVLLVILLLVASAFPSTTSAHHRYTHSTGRHYTHSTRYHRSREVTREFQRSHPCPSTGKRYGRCPGYVKDHIRALCDGGSDSVTNLQWQTTGEARAKDKTECSSGHSRRRR